MQRLYWDAINIDSHKVFYTVNEQGLNFVSSPECGLSQVLNFYAQSFEYVHDHEVTDAYRKSFKRYLKGKTGEFVVDRDSFVNGTPQEEEVWQRIAAIPYGKTQSVAVLAAEAKVSQQVVLQALQASPVWLVLPLHRVTGRGTKQLNFRTNQAMQDYLLQIEQKPKAEFKELL